VNASATTVAEASHTALEIFISRNCGADKATLMPKWVFIAKTLLFVMPDASFLLLERPYNQMPDTSRRKFAVQLPN
jgi:hypothetical protein